MSDLATGSVTVPSSTVGDLYAFVATLHATSEEPPVGSDEDLDRKDALKARAAAGFGAADMADTP